MQSPALLIGICLALAPAAASAQPTPVPPPAQKKSTVPPVSVSGGMTNPCPREFSSFSPTAVPPVFTPCRV